MLSLEITPVVRRGLISLRTLALPNQSKAIKTLIKIYKSITDSHAFHTRKCDSMEDARLPPQPCTAEPVESNQNLKKRVCKSITDSHLFHTRKCDSKDDVMMLGAKRAIHVSLRHLALPDPSAVIKPASYLLKPIDDHIFQIRVINLCLTDHLAIYCSACSAG